MSTDPPTPFGLLAAGHPLLTTPSSQPAPTSFLYLLPYTTPAPTPTPRPFAHLAVFLLPGVALPAGTAAAIYVAHNPSALAHGGSEADADFRFLGGVGPGKESAVFRLGNAAGPGPTPNSASSPSPNPNADGVVIGINIEDASAVAAKVEQNSSSSSSSSSSASTAPSHGSGQHDARRPPPPHQQQQPSTQVLAQRIIQNAFNFLTGFSGNVGAGPDGSTIEVVPLKAFQDWWRKFEHKVKMDPSFLEREQD
ncbi:hypothetical protein F5Y15DRAFT_216474 [Xylariaceae sp. FL0016]|nr:hypothetical protein F5Y15DRAFT_216474 [Xylariaceae sp. FL0016]